MTRYSLLYAPPIEQKDSIKMRRRLARLFYHFLNDGKLGYAFQQYVELLGWRHGEYSRQSSQYTDHWDDVCDKAPLEMLLDMISCYLQFRTRTQRSGFEGQLDATSRQNFRDGVKRIFEEEKILLRLGDGDVVHPRIDPAFDAQYTELLRDMNAKEHAQAIDCLQDAEGFYMSGDFASSIEKVHKAAENIFKQTYQKLQLGSKTLKDVEGDFLTALMSMLPETNSSQQVPKNTFVMIQDWISSIIPIAILMKTKRVNSLTRTSRFGYKQRDCPLFGFFWLFKNVVRFRGVDGSLKRGISPLYWCWWPPQGDSCRARSARGQRPS